MIQRELLQAWKETIEDVLNEPENVAASAGFEAWLRAGGSSNLKAARAAALRAMAMAVAEQIATEEQKP